MYNLALIFKTRLSFLVITKTVLNQLLIQNLYKLVMFEYGLQFEDSYYVSLNNQTRPGV